jgi:hypothetical protein
MHADHAIFLDAIAQKRRLTVRFVSPKEQKELVRICAALDFGPLRGSSDGLDRYHLWDLQGKKKPFNLPLLATDILAMTPLDETFDPAEIITWSFKPNAWHVVRDWGPFS